MPRYKLTIEYDGAPFCGWQVQADQVSVQGLLTAAIEALSGDKTLVQGAGRTDAGVHARAQIAHVDLTKEWDIDTVRDALNAHLRPHPIAVLAAERVPDELDDVARSAAVSESQIFLVEIILRTVELFGEALLLDLGQLLTIFNFLEQWIVLDRAANRALSSREAGGQFFHALTLLHHSSNGIHA